MSSSQSRASTGSGQAKPELQKMPASLKNIKRLSTCEDVVTLKPKTE